MQITGFRPKFRLDGGMPMVIPFIISNTMTLEEGDRTKAVGGAGIEPADAVTDKSFGYVTSFVTKKHLPLRNAVRGTDYDGTYTPSPDGDTYVSASDNLTDKQVYAMIALAQDLVVSAKVDATLGTTTGSNKVGYYLDILTTDSTQLDEDSATTSVANFLTIPGRNAASCVDQEDTSRVYCIAAELQTVGDAVAQTT